ncbi:MAG: HAD hydrolase-like protein, partial [Alphaproteobacteria bacterium]
IVVKQNGQEMICAGLLGLEYEKMGGIVNYYGKPHQNVYNRVFEKYNNPPKSRFLAVGDSLETDIKGANDFGIDSILLTGGVLSNKLGVKFWQDPLIENLNKLCDKYNIYPKHIISNLKL